MRGHRIIEAAISTRQAKNGTFDGDYQRFNNPAAETSRGV